MRLMVIALRGLLIWDDCTKQVPEKLLLEHCSRPRPPIHGACRDPPWPQHGGTPAETTTLIGGPSGRGTSTNMAGRASRHWTAHTCGWPIILDMKISSFEPWCVRYELIKVSQTAVAVLTGDDRGEQSEICQRSTWPYFIHALAARFAENGLK